MPVLHRFFLPARECRRDPVRLSPGDADHAVKVLRLRAGARISVLDGAGHELLCSIAEIRGDGVTARILTRSELPAPSCPIHLVQGVTKGRSMDWIIQKATELGCRRILPVISERTVLRLDRNEARNRKERWDSIAIESMKQCGQGWMPEILAPVPFDELMSEEGLPRRGLSLVASLSPDAEHPRIPLTGSMQEPEGPPEDITVWIGPEGDFTPAEINRIRQGGARPISLGRLILRSETAAVYALSVLNYEMSAVRASS